MIQEALNFNLSDQLVDEPSLPLENSFGDFLECTDEIDLFVAASEKNYTARYTEPNWPSSRYFRI